MLKRIYIEITSGCNSHCAFCTSHLRPASIMTPAQFEHILKQIYPYTRFIYLHVQGEPLLHPNLEEILTLCDHYQMHVQLTTNFTLHDRLLALLDHPCLRKIAISLQAIPYSTIHMVTYRKSLITLWTYSKQNLRPYIEMRLWRKELSQHPLIQMIFQDIQTYFNHHDLQDHRLSKTIFLGYDEPFQWPSIQPSNDQNYGYCHGAISQLAILVDGTVVACCLDAQGEIQFGNIFHTSLEHILQTDRYQKMVAALRNHQLIEPLCQSCTYRQRFQK